MNTKESIRPNQKDRSKRISVLVITGILALGGFFAFRGISSAPKIPIPQDFDQLSPQLRDTILEAVNETRKSISNPDNHIVLGIIYEANHLWPEAVAAFENVHMLSPNEPLALRHQALAYRHQGLHNETRNSLNRLLHQFPDFAPARYDSADLYHFIGDYKKAESEYEMLVEIAPNEWRGYSGLGDLYLQTGRAEQAVTVLEQALQLAPQERIPHYLLGRAYRKTGRNEEAAKELALGSQSGKYTMPDAWLIKTPLHIKTLEDQLEVAKQYYHAGSLEQAVAILTETKKYHPENVDVLRSLALTDLAADDPRGAFIRLEKIIKTDPGHTRTYILLATACLELEMKDLALQHAAKAVELNSSSPETHFILANVLLELKQNEGAIHSLQDAIAVDPSNLALRMEVGDILLMTLNRQIEAEGQYQKVLDLNPDYFPAYIRLFQIYAATEENEKAETIRTKALERFPESNEILQWNSSSSP